MSVLDDDVDRGLCAQPVSVQSTESVNRVVLRHSNAIVERRQRQNADVIDYLRYTSQMLDRSLGIVFHNGLRHFARQRYNTIVDAVVQVVEHAVVRDHHQLMANLVRQILGRITVAGEHRHTGNH